MTNTNTFWRDYGSLINLPSGYYDMMDAIKTCNLPEHFKYAVLAKMSGYDSRHDEVSHYVRENILRALTAATRPMRIGELTGEYTENYPNNLNAALYGRTTQRVAAQMKYLVAAGLVKRTEKQTGQTIEVTPGKFVDEVIAYFEIVA